MEKKLSVTLVRSPLGRLPKQRATVKALGLGKLQSVVELPANDAVKGMIAKVQHLVAVKEI
ncbi:50S ribosomal protein L30 [Entomospira entomophila]|uniref:Large ribosomal subunit protein uL30 n=1 Tax=Entomospira entomophila TaxID=2719988 RepID=A0A968G927_9SPIO|nr:50S ribosomal protein L30 [Entomospira entomophilus]NIZ40236.1 50S ribosomal protein L30 [Entomospira entomophilus]WDI35795.1 50S ribosomal protein L30 [Entomospira entomophilus]